MPRSSAIAGDSGHGTRDDRIDNGDDTGRRDEWLVPGRRADAGDGALEDTRVVVVPTGDEVGLEFGAPAGGTRCGCDSFPAPSARFRIHLREADDHHPTEEIDDGQQHECEGDEAGSEVGPLGGECECHHGAPRAQPQRSTSGSLPPCRRGFARRAGFVLGRQDLERVRPRGHLGRGRVRWNGARGGIGVERGRYFTGCAEKPSRGADAGSPYFGTGKVSTYPTGPSLSCQAWAVGTSLASPRRLAPG